VEDPIAEGDKVMALIICSGNDTARPYLTNRNLVLLANHGVLAVGSTLEKAFCRVEAAEKFVQIISISSCVGKLTDIPQSEIDRILARPLET
jgi:ribulose-5-phosphate 4-epimerase/fuculose-1-phosphate aldolase